MPSKNVLLVTLVLACMVLTGYVNLNASEVQPPMLLLLLSAGLLGFLQPKAAWRWGLIIGLTIPLSYFVGLAINYKIVDPPRYPITTAILIIPALVAAYCGALARKVLVSVHAGQTS